METGQRNFSSKRRYLYAFLIASVMFGIVLLMSYLVGVLRYQRVIDLQNPISYEIFEDKLSYSMFGKDICSSDTFKNINEDLFYQGNTIGRLEEEFGKHDSNVIFRKKFFTLIQMEHFEFIKSINENCNKSIDSILFFYSNEDGYLQRSEDMGKLLSTVYKKHKDNLVLYSIDMDLDTDLLKNLKKKYGLSGGPVIIVNEVNRVSNFENIDDIEQYLYDE